MSWTVEVVSRASAARMFDAAILDWHNLGPEIAAEALVSGTGEGSLRQLNYSSAMPFSYLKERMDIVDHEGFECESTITEGGPLGTRVKSASVNYKIVETTNGGGCVIKVVITLNLLPGVELDAEDTKVIDIAKNVLVKHFETAEVYLLANPDKYCSISPTQEKSVLYDEEDDELPHDEGHDGLPSGGDEGGDSHPRDFYGNQINGIVFGDVVQGQVKPPAKVIKRKVVKRVVRKPAWSVRVRIG